MSNLYQIYLISDSTGETLDRIFTAIKVQFKNIKYKIQDTHLFFYTNRKPNFENFRKRRKRKKFYNFIFYS